MKNKITKLFLALLSLASFGASAQNMPVTNRVVEDTNSEFLMQFSKEKAVEFQNNFEVAKKIANEKGLPLYGKEDGYVFSLVGTFEDGSLNYFRTTNNTPVNSSLQTANAKPLHTAGVKGAGMKTAVWDGGVGLTGHSAFVGGRYVVKDNGNSPAWVDMDGKNHSAHVAGTVAGGFFGTGYAMGFATEAQIYAYNWDSDISEMAAAAAAASNKIYVSNHSYGLNAKNYFASGGTSAIYGQYNSSARSYDVVANNAPYYTIVFAAGNDRDSYSKYNPTKNGKDLLSQGGVAKNVVVVAATRGTEDFSGVAGAASVSGTNAFISGFSNFGPTDDYRIKPDIAAKGVDVLSITAAGISATDTYDGTSMAAPAVTGVFTLWQSYFNSIFKDQWMRSSTVRALMAHTAREAGPAAGPDFMFGWGLIDANKGKQVMDAVALELAKIAEIKLDNSTVKEYEFDYTGAEPLVVTIAWNDPAAVANTSNNLDVPHLVNDLDLRVENVETGDVYYPWSLVRQPNISHTSTSIATNLVDNVRDNIEKVEVTSNVPGKYRVKVNHKKTLNGGSQYFSLIISGAGTKMPFLDNSVSTKEQQALEGIAIYPNPATSILNIAGSSDLLENSLVEIYDVSGKKVYDSTISINNNSTINIEALQQGVYLLNISKEGAKKTYKFVKK